MVREATWSRIGTDVKSCMNIEEVLTKANLNYNVGLEEINCGEIFIPDKKATIATLADGSKSYKGVVSNNYTICQNIDAFDFVNNINNEITFEKAGETKTGMVYIIASLAPIEVFGDKITPYVILQNSHNGRYTFKATICPLRIVCQNQFNMSFKESPNTISIIHSNLLEYKMEMAQQLLVGAADYMKDFKVEAEKMFNTKLSREQVFAVIDSFFKKSQEDIDEMSARQTTIIEKNRENFIRCYNADDNQNFVGTKLGLVNAFTDFTTHKDVKEKSFDSRFLTVTFDPRLMNMFMQNVNAIAA